MDRKWFRSRGSWLVLHVVLVGLWVAGCGDDTMQTCEYGGKTHEFGDLFPSSDGCNMCGCEAGGEISCTTRDCSGDAGCDDDGVERDQGERWMAEGCRSCVCNSNGTITCSVAAGCEVTCTYNGKNYLPGPSFPASDGCNTCTCQTSGEVACTQLGCTGSCTYGNQIIPVGTTFEATDGCNECSCEGNGVLKCTTNVCSQCMYNGRFYNEGQEFLTDDGCTTCLCGPNGGSTCSSAECPEDSCHYGASWYAPGEEVICPDGCSTCTCAGELAWETSRPITECRRRYAELCAAGPGANQVAARLLYLEGDSLAVDLGMEGCESSYLLCFNPQPVSDEPLPVDVWLVQLEGMCAVDQLRSQFVFDVATIRDHIQPRYMLKLPMVSLQVGGEQVDYPF